MPRSLSRPAGTALAAVSLAAPLALLTAAPAAAADPASVTVVHGVRGLVADVRLDGKLVLSGFAPERVTDALRVPAGRHRIQAWPSGADEDTEPVVDEFLTLEAGQQATAAIGLDGEGNADITLYDDEELLPEEGDTALVVRGLAEADAVRVLAGDRTVAPSLTSASQGLARVPAGLVRRLGPVGRRGRHAGPVAGGARGRGPRGRALPRRLAGRRHPRLGRADGPAQRLGRTDAGRHRLGPAPGRRPARGAAARPAGRRARRSRGPPARPRVTRPRRAPAGLLLLALAALPGCAASTPAAAPPAAVVPATTPAASPPPPAGSLLGSRPATLDDLRSEQQRRPVRVRVPGVRRPAPVEVRTTDPVGGGLDLPEDAATVAWWGSGSSPGDGAGSVVLAAHVTFAGERGPFTDLVDVERGAVVVVTSEDGTDHRYVVEGVRSADKDALDREELFRTTGPPSLALVTCGGAYDPVTRSYASNVVVTARPA